MPNQYVLKSAFNSPADEFNKSGKRPVVFDIIAPDKVTSLLPDDLKMVLHVNPSSMSWNYTNQIERTQTLGGWVEAHWGQAPTEVSMSSVTGGFVRLYTGLSNITGPTESSSLIQPTSMQPVSVGGTRRDTIAYDKFLDLLALFHSNGAIYDVYGNIALQGQILMTYDGGSWWGWFTTFSVEESQEKPYQFNLSVNFVVEREKHRIRGLSVPMPQGPSSGGTPGRTPQIPTSRQPSGNIPAPLREGGFEAALDQEIFGGPLTPESLGLPPQVQPGQAPTRRRR
jgi:hypothetical protein